MNRLIKPAFTLAMLLFGAAFAPSAAADTFGLTDELVVDAGGLNQVFVQIGPVKTPAPLVVFGTANHTGVLGETSSSTGFVSSDYGVLQVSGSGQAAPGCQAGIGCNGIQSRVISVSGDEPLAAFKDRVTVTSADGTPMIVTFTLRLTGTATTHSEPGGPPSDASTASFSDTLRFNDGSFNFQLDQNGPGSVTTIHSVVLASGDAFDISDGLFGEGQASSDFAFGPSDFAFSGDSTLCIDVEGGSLTSDSGSTYCSSAPVSDTPEPATFALVGPVPFLLGIVTWCKRRVV
jgi:hypothetical protein